MIVRIATRGSLLALEQSKWVADKLATVGYKTELRIIKTQGDILLDKPLHEIGGKGLFTKEVDRAVLDNKADVSVHSLKDMPVEDESGLILGAIPERESCEDVLVINENNPENMDIGCGSLRRRAQLKNFAENYNFQEVRGNIHTRLKKMIDNNWGGLVVAEAALKRLHLDKEYYYKKLGILPAAGQGALGLRVREDDEKVKSIINELKSVKDEICAKAESEFLRSLGGGCHLPAGVRSEIKGEKFILKGGVFSLSSEKFVIMKTSGETINIIKMAKKLAENILDNGGKEILDSFKL